MILFWLGCFFALVVSGAGLVIFPCLILAGRADRQMHRSWDEWASQCDEGLFTWADTSWKDLPVPPKFWQNQNEE